MAKDCAICYWDGVTALENYFSLIVFLMKLSLQEKIVWYEMQWWTSKNFQISRLQKKNFLQSELFLLPTEIRENQNQQFTQSPVSKSWTRTFHSYISISFTKSHFAQNNYYTPPGWNLYPLTVLQEQILKS